MKQPGTFDDGQKEFTVTEMFPRRLWKNFLWNEFQATTIDQHGCGPGWNYEGAVRTNLCRAKDSRLVFLRDETTQKYWAANRNYLREPFDEFYTVVGQGYSRIVSRYRGIRSTLLLFVPGKGNCECWSVEVENTGRQTRELSLFAYADADMNITYHSAYNHGSFDRELNGILLAHHGFALNTPLTNIFFAADLKPAAYETTNRRFRGVYGNIQNPDALGSAKLASQATTFDAEMICALQFKLKLQPGQKKKIHCLFGHSRTREEAVRICREKLSAEMFARELANIRTHVESFTRRVAVTTPDKNVNRMANIWLKRQMDFGKAWGRGYSKGFRDIMQDLTGFMSLAPDAAGERIKYCLKYQYANGNTLREWEPALLHPYRDGAVWIIPAVANYLKETGNVSFLQEEVPYYQGKESGSVLDHCRRGMNFLMSELGPHGLCLWGGGDWNDSLNNAGLQLKGESVWLSEATVTSGKEFAELLEMLGEKDEVARLKEKIRTLTTNLLKHGWEQDHFLCGYTDWGDKVGSYENTHGKIFLNMQTWAVLAGILDDKESGALMDLIEKELACPFGYILMKPSYIQGDDHLGRISYMEKGSYENGAVYNHGGAFKIAADCKLGRGNQAYQTIVKMLATNKQNDALKSGVEPYAVTNMYLGPENGLRAGESVMGWITGTAGWLFRCIIEYIVGVKAGYQGLTIAPCLPAAWKDISVRREYRNAVYNIRILNPTGLQTGRLRVTVDNQPVAGNTLPDFNDNQEHSVIVELLKS